MKLEAGHSERLYGRLWPKPMVIVRGHAVGFSAHGQVKRRPDGSYYEVAYQRVFRFGARQVPLGPWHHTGLS